MSNRERKKITIGSWLSMGSPYIAEIKAKSGFDWLVIDMEHSAANDLKTVQQLIQVIDLAGSKPLVRVALNEPTNIKLVLDAGAHGVIVPMVNSKEEAEAAVASAHYPPEGFRGVGLWRAQAYGKGFDQYRSWYKREGVLLVQIEHYQAVEALSEILSVEGVDGFLIGPYDLSASLGMPGDFDHPSFMEALSQVRSIAIHTDKWMGIHIVHPDQGLLKTRIEEGYNFIAYGVDFTYLTTAIDAEMSVISKLLGRGAETETNDVG